MGLFQKFTAIRFRSPRSSSSSYLLYRFFLPVLAASPLTEKRLLVKTVGGESRFIEGHSETRCWVSIKYDRWRDPSVGRIPSGDTEGQERDGKNDKYFRCYLFARCRAVYFSTCIRARPRSARRVSAGAVTWDASRRFKRRVQIAAACCDV